MLHQMTWLPQSPDLNSIEMVWDELNSRVKESPFNFSKTVGKAFQVECQACAKLSSRQRVATLRNLKSKIYFHIITLFWLLHDSICVIS